MELANCNDSTSLKNSGSSGGQFKQYITISDRRLKIFFYHFWNRDFQLLCLIIACCYNTVDVNTTNWSKHETGILTSSPTYHLQIRRNGLFLDLDP